MRPVSNAGLASSCRSWSSSQSIPNFLAAPARAPRAQPFDRITPPTSQNNAVTSDTAPPQSRPRDPAIVSEPGENTLPPSKIFFGRLAIAFTGLTGLDFLQSCSIVDGNRLAKFPGGGC